MRKCWHSDGIFAFLTISFICLKLVQVISMSLLLLPTWIVMGLASLIAIIDSFAFFAAVVKLRKLGNNCGYCNIIVGHPFWAILLMTIAIIQFTCLTMQRNPVMSVVCPSCHEDSSVKVIGAVVVRARGDLGVLRLSLRRQYSCPDLYSLFDQTL